MSDVESAVRRVVAAWRDPGPFPPMHGRALADLRRDWPALATAVEQLARAVDGKP